MQIYCTVRHWTKGGRRSHRRTTTAFLRVCPLREPPHVTPTWLPTVHTPDRTCNQSHQVRLRPLRWQKWSEIPVVDMVANKRNWWVRGFSKAKVADWLWNPIKGKSVDLGFSLSSAILNLGVFRAYDLSTVEAQVVKYLLHQTVKTVRLWLGST